MKQFTSKTQKIGEYGEKIAEKYITRNLGSIVECNYTIQKGEIDIIYIDSNQTLHFVEVKSIQKNQYSKESGYNPAQNMTQRKIQKCKLAMKHYLTDNNVSYETLFQIDLFLVYIDQRDKKHQIQIIENII